MSSWFDDLAKGDARRGFRERVAAAGAALAVEDAAFAQDEEDLL